MKSFQYRGHCRGLELAKPLDQALDIDRPKLVEGNEATAAAEAASRAPRIRAPASRHRRDDQGAEVLVQFVRGHDRARPRLLDLAVQRRIESNEVDLSASDRRVGYRDSQSS